MRDKAKKIIANTVTAIVGVYGLLGLLAYGLHPLATLFAPLLNVMAQHFILIPFAVVTMLMIILVPIAVLIFLVIVLNVGLYKVMGLSDW